MPGRRLSLAEKRRADDLQREGWSTGEIAQALKRSRTTIHTHLRGRPKNGKEYRALSEPGARGEGQEPILFNSLSKVARDCLEDFGRFRGRYMGRLATPWQEEAAAKVVELLATPRDEYLVINVAPGTGKSTLFTEDIPAWLTARDRAVRGFIGSATQQMAASYCGRLKRHFERRFPSKAKERDVRLALGRDAEAALAVDYGAFKPQNPDIWKRDQFTVAHFGETPSDEKESTWTAFGMDTGFLGWRVDFIIWDDLVTSRVMKSQESVVAQRAWWEDEAETRLEPGGLLVLQGQRLRSDDLYRHCLDMLATDELEMGDDPDARDETRKYHHIVFKAHYEENCTGDHKPLEAKYYPEGCLLDPKRLSWNKLKAIKANRAEKFRVLYQQEDVDPEAVLVPILWVNGGTGADGIDYPGCWDHERTAGVAPKDVIGTKLSVVTCDPSPTRYWSIQHWLYSQPDGVDDGAGLRYLIDHERRVMDAPELLEWSPSLGMYTGLLEDWWQRSKDQGIPITHLVVEANAAQRFMLQYEFFKRWCQLRSVNLIPHQTQRNKLDPELGIQASIPQHWRHGRVRLPGEHVSRLGSMKLVDEVTRWPDSRTDDAVMALWFFEYHLSRLNLGNVSIGSIYGDMPRWLRRQIEAA